jgi:UDP-N-acetylmuramyl pentapeptide phosphotransferase/UDP-N-acetylglucosamine-1-phosphate transferase
MNKYQFFIFSLVVSLLSCLLFSMSIEELFSDADYVKSMNLPSNADSLMIPLAGGVAISLLVALIFVVLHLLFIQKIRKQKDQPTIDLDLRIGRKYGLWRNISILFFYLIALFWIKTYYGDAEHKFYLVNTLFYVSALLMTLIIAVWMVNFLFPSMKESDLN